MSNSSQSSPSDVLPPQLLAQLDQLCAQLSPGQTLLAARILLERFDAIGLASDQFELAQSTQAAAEAGLTILYGTHSGHSASIAKLLATKATAKGWSVKLSNVLDYPARSLKQENHVAFIVSTHGEGQPPESATAFFEFLGGKRAPRLEQCQFSVLALGDRTYTKFCQAGIDLDERLSVLGARRILERVDLDVDYQEGAEAWIDAALQAFAPHMTSSVSRKVAAPERRHSRIDRENPWSAEVLENVVLSGRGSTQRYAHLELSLEGSGLRYEPGDAIGVRPENDPFLVEQLLETMNVKADTTVSFDGRDCPLVDVLTRRVDFTQVTPTSLRKYEKLGAATLTSLLKDAQATTSYARGRDWLDVLREHPASVAPSDLVALLPELSPRSYSIASSLVAHPDEVHLLVSRVAYESLGRSRTGVASGYLVDRLASGSRVPLWIEPNRQFRLPTDPSAAIILVGAGTGIAPFRSFLEHRAATGATGRNWVIFGNRQFRTDFTYQAEWLKWQESGVLTRMDVAFSRDRQPKRYVTDELRTHGKDLYAWLEQGASIYLCGDRAKLSAATDQVLEDVLMSHGARSQTQAAEYLNELVASKRYLKDVY